MKTDCRVIEDLIPLYLDGVCSVQTKELVEEHLGGCENCRKLIEQVHPVNMIAPAGEDAVTDRTVKKAFKKIRLPRHHHGSVAGQSIRHLSGQHRQAPHLHVAGTKENG